MRQEIHACGLEDEVQITACGSLGLCERGPNMVVYPERIWYSGVTARDVGDFAPRNSYQGLDSTGSCRSRTVVSRSEFSVSDAVL